MSDGIYTALSGALARQAQLESVSHNLANVNTAGFRQSRVSFAQTLVDAQGGVHQVRPSGQTLDLSEGPLEMTGEPLDVAISGQGFLRVGGAGDQATLTRDGRLKVTDTGRLQTRSGLDVLSPEGTPLELGAVNLEEVLIDEEGGIWDALGRLGTIGVVEVQDPAGLRTAGAGLYQTELGNLMPPSEHTELIQGSVESSNMNVVEGMTDMITLQRHFDAMQTLIQTHKQMDQKAVSVVGANRA